jgi:serine O-acetyltransferase
MPPTVEIGPGCTLHQGVTLGLGPKPGLPRLGRNVTVMPGARVLGGVTLGDGVEVGANAVVTKDVPAGVVVASPVPRVSPRAPAAGGDGGSLRP